MPDPLRAFVNARDKANARPHRLEPERLVLPDRGQSARRICAKACGWSVSEHEWRYGHWEGPAVAGPVMGTVQPSTCLRCGAEIVEVVN